MEKTELTRKKYFKNCFFDKEPYVGQVVFLHGILASGWAIYMGFNHVDEWGNPWVWIATKSEWDQHKTEARKEGWLLSMVRPFDDEGRKFYN